eukprot:TRINITY_DN21640_c0_g1_i3.p1 TRINITY_DN21640_c0_g1~~TRINITY_DN21640_c0_g1_i3.p1  ORF type:complete len:117 (-),score=21.74 TRINITY_DN21640_c0_g1_i3:28-378(-)
MSLNPPFSPDSIQATTSLSQVMDKEMQETMVRCHTEIQKDSRDRGQCQCWASGGGGGNVVELSWKTAFQRSRYNLHHRKCTDLPFSRGKLLVLLWTCVLLVIWVISYSIMNQLDML